MDVTLIWFPLMKAVFTALLIYGAYYFWKKEKTIIAIWYTVLVLVFWLMMPIKYDGTNSVERSVVTQQMRTEQYDEVKELAVVIETKKPTFTERLEAEAMRSEIEDAKTRGELIQ